MWRRWSPRPLGGGEADRRRSPAGRGLRWVRVCDGRCYHHDRLTLPTPTTVIPGAPDVAMLSEMVAGLCETSALLTAGRAVAARSLFYARSHDTIHLLMDAVRPAEPELAGELEEAKNELEVRFGHLFQDDVAAEMEGLVAALTPVLALVGGHVIDC